MRPIDLQDRGRRNISPLELGLVELPTRPRSEFTASIRREAIQATSQGRLTAAADLTLAAMTEDGYAFGVLGSLTHGLWGLPMNFIGNAAMIAALVDSPQGAGEWRTMFPQPEAIRLMQWGVTLGVGVGQMRRRYHAPGDNVISLEEAADGSYHVRRPMRPVGANDTRVLRTWDPRNLRHEYDTDSWWLLTADGEIRITPNDGEWLLYTPYGAVKPWEYGAWKALTLAYVLGRDGVFDRSRHAEVLAPVRVGKVPAGTTERQRKDYLRKIREMQRMHVFVLPPGLEYSIVEGSGRIVDIYEQVISWAERVVRLIFTGNETTTTGSSGFSTGSVQERIAKTTLKSFAGSFASCLHDGGLVEWSIANYGSNDPPLAFFDCDPPEDKLARAKTVSEAGDSLVKMATGLEKVGLRITTESATAYAQTFGFAVEAIPVSPIAAVAARFEVTPSAVEKVFTADEIRANEGAGPTKEAWGGMTIAQIDALATALPPAAPAAAPQEPAAPVLVASEDDTPPTDESASRLAAKMTEHALERCGHGSLNVCRKCGVTRDRDFDMGPDGQPVWHVKWKPIIPPAAPVVVAPAGPVPEPVPLAASREVTPLEAAEALLVEALAALDALGEEPADDEIETLAHAYNPDQERGNDGKFGSGSGGKGHEGPRDPRVAAQGTKDGLGRSRAAGIARKGSTAAQGATDAAKSGGSHEDAAKAHADAAAQHHEAAARSIRADYKAAHLQAAAAHEGVAKAHADEYAKATAPKAEPSRGLGGEAEKLSALAHDAPTHTTAARAHGTAAHVHGELAALAKMNHDEAGAASHGAKSAEHAAKAASHHEAAKTAPAAPAHAPTDPKIAAHHEAAKTSAKVLAEAHRGAVEAGVKASQSESADDAHNAADAHESAAHAARAALSTHHPDTHGMDKAAHRKEGVERARTASAHDKRAAEWRATAAKREAAAADTSHDSKSAKEAGAHAASLGEGISSFHAHGSDTARKASAQAHDAASHEHAANMHGAAKENHAHAANLHPVGSAHHDAENSAKHKTASEAHGAAQSAHAKAAS